MVACPLDEAGGKLDCCVLSEKRSDEMEILRNSPHAQTLLLKDPSNLCSSDGSDADREIFVQSVIEFLDEVDECPPSTSKFT